MALLHLDLTLAYIRLFKRSFFDCSTDGSHVPVLSPQNEKGVIDMNYFLLVVKLQE
jgi:hypothetical protein